MKHGRGGAISFLAPGQDKYTRLWAFTLAPGFDPDDIRAAIARERPIQELPKDDSAPARRINDNRGPRWTMQKRAWCSMAIRRPGIVKSIWPSTRLAAYRKARATMSELLDGARLPNKYFHGPAACEQFGVWPHPNCLPKPRNPQHGAKKRRPRFSYAPSVSWACLSPSAVGLMTSSSFLFRIACKLSFLRYN